MLTDLPPEILDHIVGFLKVADTNNVALASLILRDAIVRHCSPNLDRITEESDNYFQFVYNNLFSTIVQCRYLECYSIINNIRSAEEYFDTALLPPQGLIDIMIIALANRTDIGKEIRTAIYNNPPRGFKEILRAYHPIRSWKTLRSGASDFARFTAAVMSAISASGRAIRECINTTVTTGLRLSSREFAFLHLSGYDIRDYWMSSRICTNLDPSFSIRIREERPLIELYDAGIITASNFMMLIVQCSRNIRDSGLLKKYMTSLDLRGHLCYWLTFYGNKEIPTIMAPPDETHFSYLDFISDTESLHIINPEMTAHHILSRNDYKAAGIKLVHLILKLGLPYWRFLCGLLETYRPLNCQAVIRSMLLALKNDTPFLLDFPVEVDDDGHITTCFMSSVELAKPRHTIEENIRNPGSTIHRAILTSTEPLDVAINTYLRRDL